MLARAAGVRRLAPSGGRRARRRATRTRREKRIETLERKIATFEADAVSERKRLLEEFNAKKDEEFRELEKQIREFDTKADVERRRLFVGLKLRVCGCTEPSAIVEERRKKSGDAAGLGAPT